LSQPSLSNYISRLEDQLGLKLFDRTTTPIKLTFEGERYVQMAESILELRDEFLREIQDVKNLDKGTLTLGISDSRSSILLPTILPLFKFKFPNISVVIKQARSAELEELAIKGRTDITIMTTPIKSEHILFEPIIQEEIFLVISKDHHSVNSNVNNHNDRLVLTGDEISLLQNELFVLMPHGLKLRQIAELFFETAGIKPRIEYETVDLATAVELVRAGMGITFVPETFLLFYQKIDSLAYLSLNEFIPPSDLGFAYRKGRYLTGASREFMKLTKEELLGKNHSDDDMVLF